MKISYKLFWLVFAFMIHCCVSIAAIPAYTKPANMKNDVWEEVKPYLMPNNHPLKKKMDKLFTSFRVTENEASLKRAGFLKTTPAAFSNAIVSKNDNLKGYYFKFYDDHQQIDVESKQWIDRASEAKSLQQAVSAHGYEEFFKVPRKWIYLIPENPKSNGPYPKNFILVAKQIDIDKRSVSHYKWQTIVTRKLLRALFTLIMEEGLVDSCVAHNLPFTKDDRLAFVDLEQHHKWPVPFHRLNKYLSPKMQDYWNHLINNNGP